MGRSRALGPLKTAIPTWALGIISLKATGFCYIY